MQNAIYWLLAARQGGLCTGEALSWPFAAVGSLTFFFNCSTLPLVE